MVAAFVRTIFAQPVADAPRRQRREVATRLERSLPKAAAVLADVEDDMTAYAAFPRKHWRKIWSTGPLEQVNKEINRRTNVVGVFPNDDAVLALVGTIFAEQFDGETHVIPPLPHNENRRQSRHRAANHA